MEIEEFWSFIEASKTESGECEEQAERLASLLAKLKPDRIIEFHKAFMARSIEAYRWDLWGVAYILNGGCSDDGFQYFCNWLIGQGRTRFEAALFSPEAVADFVTGEEDEIECESLGYCAIEAYESISGNFPVLDVNFPKEPLGEPWEEEDLPARFPSLADRL